MRFTNIEQRLNEDHLFTSLFPTIYKHSTPNSFRDNMFKVKVTWVRSRVIPRSHYGVGHLNPLTNVPTKYQDPAHYNVQDTALTIIFKVKSKTNYDVEQLHSLTYVPNQLHNFMSWKILQ